ncbi:HGxxPAAW family protein [Trebonia sp.]|uniref:HGxxPAAW family protein n=1 Tax=Trebonia sp. TaxID=2767075 RepID=UPI00260522FC|nr:HGxxPAAW family protein [Trebonia sp.]
MAEQATGTVEGTGPRGTVAHSTAEVTYHGKPMSWVAVTVIIVGFVIGGIAMVPHPTWWAFWLGAGIAVIGCIMTLFAKTFSEDWY